MALEWVQEIAVDWRERGVGTAEQGIGRDQAGGEVCSSKCCNSVCLRFSSDSSIGEGNSSMPINCPIVICITRLHSASVDLNAFSSISEALLNLYLEFTK